MGLGELLKEARENKAIRLADIASVTKIPVYQLKLIEESRWDSLPARPFVKGFLSAYCRYVGLSTDEIWQQYLSEVGEDKNGRSSAEAETKETTLVSAPVPVSVRSKIFPVASLFSFLLILGLGGAAYWIIGVGKSDSVTETREVASVAPPEPTSAKTPETGEVVGVASVAELAPIPEIAEAPVATSGHRLEVEPQERTWVKIVIDDAPPVKLYLDAKQKASYEAKNKIKLVLGNGTGAQVTHNGSLDEGRIDQGTVKYYIFPRGSSFPQDKPPGNPREVSSSNSETPSEGPESVD